MDLTISTSCWNYGHYITEWADAICELEKKPKAVCMVDNGSTDNTAEMFRQAADRFRALGMRAEVVTLPERVGFSKARNLSIGMGDTEWCMHLDIDDLICRKALVYAGLYEKDADVIQFAYRSFGQKIRENYYNSGGKENLLFSMKLASAASPFRRWLWEKSPYDETMPGSMDTALWIGFLHLGARFVATDEICYRYRIHDDSLFQARSRADKQRLGLQLMALRHQCNPLVSIIVPHTPGICPHRDAAWAWLRKRYEKLYPWWEIIETDGGAKSVADWNKARAVNEAVLRANGSIIIVSDSDVILPDKAILQCVDDVLHGEAWAIPHRHVLRIDEESSKAIYAKEPDTREEHGGKLIRKKYIGICGGGIFVMMRSMFLEMGGFDERFHGWGGEDLTFGIVASAAYGHPKRYKHDLIHLYHPYQPTKQGSFGENNQDIGGEYRSNRDDRTALKRIMQPAVDSMRSRIETFKVDNPDLYHRQRLTHKAQNLILGITV